MIDSRVSTFGWRYDDEHAALDSSSAFSESAGPGIAIPHYYISHPPEQSTENHKSQYSSQAKTLNTLFRKIFGSRVLTWNAMSSTLYADREFL